MNELKIRTLAEKAGMLYDGLDRPLWAAMDQVDKDNFLRDFYNVVVREVCNEIHGAPLDVLGKSYHLDIVAEHIENVFEIGKEFE